MRQHRGGHHPGSRTTAVDFSPDGSRAYVTSSHLDTVSVIDTATKTVVATIPVGETAGVAVAAVPTASTSCAVRAGKGCGDKNHLHERETECKQAAK